MVGFPDAAIAFDKLQARIGTGGNEDPGIACQGFVLSGRDKKKMDRILNHGLIGQADIGAVGHKGGIEGSECA